MDPLEECSPAAPAPAGFSKNRIEALTDGIFAIAMTLLVLGIEVPQLFPLIPLTRLLDTLIPDIIHFVISFLALAVIWVLHHQQSHYIRSIDQTLLWMNIVWLMLVCLIPFTTSLADTYTGIRYANIPFAINLLLISLLLFAQWQHVAGHRHLSTHDLPHETRTLERNRNVVILTITFLGSILAFISLAEGIVVYLLIPVLFALFPRIDRRVSGTLRGRLP